MLPVLESNDLGVVALKASWTTFAIALITFGARVFCRLRYIPRLGGGLYSDDFMTLVCLLVIFVFCVLLGVGHGYGVGRHWIDLTATQKVESMRWSAILNAITPWMCTLPKFAILMTLQRILDFNRKTALLFWGLALTSQINVVILTLWTYLQCTPMAFQWDKSIEGGSCASPNVYSHLIYFTFAYSTALDAFFALYPIPHVMRLKMPLKTRIGVSLSLSLGMIGFAISIYKFSIFPEFGALVPTDPSYPLIYISMTHAVEGACLIIASSLITLRPLFRGIKAHITDLTGHSKGSANRSSRLSSRAFAAASTNQSQVECIISTRLSRDATAWDDDPHAIGIAELEGDIIVQKSIKVSIEDAMPKVFPLSPLKLSDEHERPKPGKVFPLSPFK